MTTDLADAVLREANSADAERLAEIGARSFAETFGHLYDPADLALFLATHNVADWRAALADPGTRVMIAETGATIAGYARVGPPTLPFEVRGQPVELRQFYVLAPWQGSGLAQRMMDWVLATGRALGGDAMYLSVFSNNRRARAFYERYDFAFVQTYAFMVGNHADEDYILCRTL